MYKDINAMTRSFDIQIEYKYHKKLHYISMAAINTVYILK